MHAHWLHGGSSSSLVHTCGSDTCRWPPASRTVMQLPRPVLLYLPQRHVQRCRQQWPLLAPRPCQGSCSSNASTWEVMAANQQFCQCTQPQTLWPAQLLVRVKCHLMVRCRSSIGDNQQFGHSVGQQRQSGPDAVWNQQQAATSQPPAEVDMRPPSPRLASAVLPHLIQPPAQQARASPLLSWLPPWLQVHLQSLTSFLHACWALLPEFVALSLPEALRRLSLVLVASLVMIVVVCTIDSAWLYLYLLKARKVPVAA